MLTKRIDENRIAIYLDDFEANLLKEAADETIRANDQTDFMTVGELAIMDTLEQQLRDV
jgi:hypothetical protein